MDLGTDWTITQALPRRSGQSVLEMLQYIMYTYCHGRSVSTFILFYKSLSLDMIEVARDRGTVHMINTRAGTSLDST